jgi:AraC-like DNA-binding protein
MPKISVPILVFLVLLFLAVRTLRKTGESRAAVPFVALLFVGALQALLISLRWDAALSSARVPQVALSALLPPLTWISFRNIAREASNSWSFKDIVHALPILLVLLAIAFRPEAIDFILIATFTVYGVLCARLALQGPDALMHAALGGVDNSIRALWLATFGLLGSAVVDSVVVFDFMRSAGAHVPVVIGAANFVWLVAIALACVFASSVLPEDIDQESKAPTAVAPTEEDENIVAHATETLRANNLFKDPNLTLTRLARRAGIPARHISQAINRLHGRNVSQFVNDMRVEEACRLLRDTNCDLRERLPNQVKLQPRVLAGNRQDATGLENAAPFNPVYVMT